MPFPNDATKFKPGESGNPNGKPKGTIHIKTLAKQIFENMDTWDRLPTKDKKQVEMLRDMVGKDKTYGQALLYAWLQKSLQDPRFATIVLELMDGKGKVEIEPGEGFLGKIKWEIEVVEPTHQAESETEAGTREADRPTDS